MTQNQIALRNVKEQERHNLAYEGETARHNQNVELETNRHNLVSEQLDLIARNLQAEANTINREHYERSDRNAEIANEIQRMYVDVQNRHYVRSDTEAVRHNLQSELISSNQILESQRHNRAIESLNAQSNAIEQSKAAETARHNFEQEEQSRFINTISGAYSLTAAGTQASQSTLNQARTATESSNQALNSAREFESYTQGAKNIGSIVTDISSEVRSWLGATGGNLTSIAQKAGSKSTATINGSSSSGSFYDQYGNWIGE